MKLEPLHNFICDECGQMIENVDDGWLESILDHEMYYSGFRIVHHITTSPLNRKYGCYYDPDRIPGTISDMYLNHYTGIDGLAELMSVFGDKLRDSAELVEIVRRLHLPHYEQARLYWQQAKADGYAGEANEAWPYKQKNLKGIIQMYAKPTLVE